MQIDTQGMEVAALSDQQLAILKEAERKLNALGGKEVYLLAVTRR